MDDKTRRSIFFYADQLYAKALEAMEAENFRMVDIFSLSSYGAATYLAIEKSGSEEFKERANQLALAARQLSDQAYAEQRRRHIEPRMSGRNKLSDRVDHEVREIARHCQE
jgi:hypothetical protein